jgi:hypothetical protein
MDSNDASTIECPCPNLEDAINRLNKHFFKRMNTKNETNKNKYKKIQLTYRVPYDEDYNWKYERPLFYCMYLSPCEYDATMDNDDMYDMDSIVYQSHQFINSQVSVEDKLLFVDVMRVFGGFHSEHEQPQLILSERCEINN